MANIKKQKVDELLTDNKDGQIDNEKEVLIKKNQEQEELIDKLTQQNEDSMSALSMLQKQMQEMQAAFIQMQSYKNQEDTSDIKYQIGCRLINGVTLYSPKREVEFRVNYHDTIEVNQYEIDMLLKQNFVRDFFKKDIIYLIDEEQYNKLKIYNRFDLGDENLTNIVLNYDSNKLIGEFNKLTRERKDDPVMHSLFYRIVELYKSGNIIRMTYENRKAIEKYFGFGIENAMMLIERVNNVK